MIKNILLFVFALSTLIAKEPNVLLFSGSTRKDSVNKKLILAAADVAKKEKANVTVIDLKNYPMPLYDGDVESEKGLPQNAEKLRKLMIESQVIVISTPEYNASVSGVLKNAIDWASRAPGAKFSKEAFEGKTFVLLSASPSSAGGVKAKGHLSEIIQVLGGKVYPDSFSLPKGHDAFNQDGKLKDPKKEQQLAKVITGAIKDRK